MEISNKHPYMKSTVHVERRRPRGDLASDSGPGGGDMAATGDSVDLTPGARDLARMEKRLAGEAEIRTEKVAELRSLIDAGDYEVDPDRVATGMVLESLAESLADAVAGGDA